MFKEYDVVKSVKRLNANVPMGSVGTILLIYTNPYPAYEVEFVDKEHKNLDVLTVVDSDIELFDKQDSEIK